MFRPLQPVWERALFSAVHFWPRFTRWTSQAVGRPTARHLMLEPIPSNSWGQTLLNDWIRTEHRVDDLAAWNARSGCESEPPLYAALFLANLRLRYLWPPGGALPTRRSILSHPEPESGSIGERPCRRSVWRLSGCFWSPGGPRYTESLLTACLLHGGPRTSSEVAAEGPI